MGVKVQTFGKRKDKADIFLYTIRNANGMEASVTNFGAILVKLLVPNNKGEIADVVLGLEKGSDYYKNGSFFGATVGRNANRIANALCKIDGVVYKLPVNDGANNLHTDFNAGFHMQLWDAEIIGNSVVFSYTSPDKEGGFPGTLKTTVTYTLTDDNALEISYDAVSDKATVINLTNHTYFNLCGHDSGCIEDTELQLNASCYTPVVKGAIPTGELAPVEGTVFDFRIPKQIGQDINAKEKQLKLVKGYDHNFVIDDFDGSLKLIAKVEDKKVNRSMEVLSDLPGVQFYAGNCIAPCTGKGGAKYDKRTGLCLETQYYPDTIHHANFPSCVFGPGKDYKSETVYRFNF